MNRFILVLELAILVLVTAGVLRVMNDVASFLALPGVITP
jgi:hypothetical protein